MLDLTESDLLRGNKCLKKKQKQIHLIDWDLTDLDSDPH